MVNSKQQKAPALGQARATRREEEKKPQSKHAQAICGSVAIIDVARLDHVIRQGAKNMSASRLEMLLALPPELAQAARLLQASLGVKTGAALHS